MSKHAKPLVAAAIALAVFAGCQQQPAEEAGTTEETPAVDEAAIRVARHLEAREIELVAPVAVHRRAGQPAHADARGLEGGTRRGIAAEPERDPHAAEPEVDVVGPRRLCARRTRH